jgi:hypothetical protein
MKTKKKTKVETRWVVETLNHAQWMVYDIDEAMDHIDTLVRSGISSSEITLYKAVLQPVEW